MISEASRHFSHDLMAQHNELRWKDSAEIGNILRYEYQHVDPAIVWKAVQEHLPELKSALSAIKKHEQADS